MSRIYWDTLLFVYWLEDHPQQAPKVKKIFEKMEQRSDVLCTSTFTMAELLVGPKKRGSSEVAQQIKDFLHTSVVDLLPFTRETAEHYANIRAANHVSPADAIHLASAAEADVNLFLTNDHRLRGLIIPGIHFIAGMDIDLF
ncbi:MAG: PilT protein [Bryobacterales bacterium]|nr:PilT protein [Bryobacterales bacterium]